MGMATVTPTARAAFPSRFSAADGQLPRTEQNLDGFPRGRHNFNMADRSIHYEAAFEAYLRDKRIPYVAVDEVKKALFANAKLKSFDFVVYPQNKPRLLVDVKGRSLRNRAKRSGFETWRTGGGVRALLQWERVFGAGFTAVLVFAYWIAPP